MSVHRSTFHGRLLAGVAAISLLTAFGAHAEDLTQFDIAPQPLSSALNEFATQSKMAVLFTPELAGNRLSAGLSKEADPETALAMMLQGTGLTWKRNADTFIIVSASDPQSGSAAGDGADQGTVAALIVTAQKREEQIQDVPIAISAFTEKSLQEQKIEGGFDLLKAIPNVTFSKNNFTSYNFSIRGIGTKAVSATTDPGVAVAFNNAALIQNRLFEQEYFDVERVEVLRGPQGTLYGRNATAGVINVISAKPNLSEFSGWLKGEVGNYHSKRASAMVNVPLITDKLAVRFAGAFTDRQGYDFNDTTKHAVNGRDLWSGRITVGFNPTDSIRTNLVWERFNEDDNRSRTGKQLCKRDPAPTMIGSAPVGADWVLSPVEYQRSAFFSQGCLPVSLYDKSAFEVPNGLSLPLVNGINFAEAFFPLGFFLNGTDPGNGAGLLYESVNGVGYVYKDPYLHQTQSQDLREINSPRDPIYRAKADVVQLSVDWDLSPSLTLSSQTTYNNDSVYSFQDYNRFKSDPIFTNTSALFTYSQVGELIPSSYRDLAPGGILCDPQVGCSDTISGFDISKAKSSQFIQELRLQSDYDGPLNFSVGANYTRFKVLVDYYVMFNLLTATARVFPFNIQGDSSICIPGELLVLRDPVPADSPEAACPYIDPNPLESINGEGHNYFRSKNPYKLQSSAAFGELYWRKSDNLKVTLGLRYTDDRKTFTPVPSQLLLATGWMTGGKVSRGYPEDPDIKQHWGEFTGRLGFDWKPDLSFTDDTMLYAFYSRGYKGGGANPPKFRFTKEWISTLIGFEPGVFPTFDRPALDYRAENVPDTFKPEFVNAFEVGAKNTLLGGALTFNTDAFFYDYKDYQVSKIVDRTASNENFDARVWGLEFETLFAPSRNLRIVGNLGYLDTRIGKGARSIDIMNRTASDPNYTLLRPWSQYPSNCVVPTALVEQQLLMSGGAPLSINELCGPYWYSIIFGYVYTDPATGEPYNVDNYPQLNGGAGIAQNLEGRELPNSPHWTANLGAQYAFEFRDGWRATIRADGYWQSQSWARVYNAVNDKLHGWYNANLSFWIENDDGLKIELYAKNILDKTPITDSFINSDDTALTTNVFVLDPRLIGLSIRKEF